MKIKAYTLMEVTVAMLISAICISICYTAYALVGDYYKAFAHKNETVDRLLSLRHVIQADFTKSKNILRSSDGFTLAQDSIFIHYQFAEKGILRKLGEVHTDTFDLKFALLETYFEQVEALEADTIDQVRFTVFLDKQFPVKMQFDKYYSAQDLFK